ncbi:hypothetical protein [Brevundimonas subvibrioides]|uniref:Uncharacterized protein n=1 Tax=Brevundimonas subvibrioides (strain ATCC 15264 / DSM 4735 / LMG 14903 / NBRC 16000 / CB 81) TaxID=633149 RepID=D9QLH2_BRESC|nr:hypothetical protein [Brevundimonas subvibrioides]ADL01866.1 hypothetical protein Bresu_2559 [Brevundimonas subvibrioides ATCC 15264]
MKKTLLAAASTAALVIGMSAFGTAAMAQATMTVTNTGEVPIVELAISGTSVEDFGDNLLDEEIAPGDAVEVTFDVGDDCVQDVMATYEDGDTEEVYDVDLCEGGGFEVEDDDVDEEDPSEDEEEDEDDAEDEEEDEEEEDEEEDEEEEDDAEDEEEEEEEEEE